MYVCMYVCIRIYMYVSYVYIHIYSRASVAPQIKVTIVIDLVTIFFFCSMGRNLWRPKCELRPLEHLFSGFGRAVTCFSAVV